MRTITTLLAGALALTACSQPKELRVDGAWVRLAAVPGHPAAAYFDVHGGLRPATLVDVSTDVAIKTEMHETMTRGTMSTMAPLPSVAIPAKGVVHFAPGGKHVMVFDVSPTIKPGGTMTFTFTFKDGLRLLQDATVVGAADPEPK